MPWLFSRKNSEYKHTVKTAEQASKFARSLIQKSSTLPDGAELTQEQQEHLQKGIQGSKMHENAYGIRDLIDEYADRLVEDGEDPVLAIHKAIVSVTSKYSLGNCNEFSILALDWVVKNAPEVRAEVYKIENGDHSFVVLNRDFYSEAHKPETWGLNAVVCDPWNDLIYPASECAKKLKNYRYDEKTQRHFSEPYDSKKHFLMPSAFFNTTTLRNQ